MDLSVEMRNRWRKENFGSPAAVEEVGRKEMDCNEPCVQWDLLHPAASPFQHFSQPRSSVMLLQNFRRGWASKIKWFHLWIFGLSRWKWSLLQLRRRSAGWKYRSRNMTREKKYDSACTVRAGERSYYCGLEWSWNCAVISTLHDRSWETV